MRDLIITWCKYNKLSNNLPLETQLLPYKPNILRVLFRLTTDVTSYKSVPTTISPKLKDYKPMMTNVNYLYMIVISVFGQWPIIIPVYSQPNA